MTTDYDLGCEDTRQSLLRLLAKVPRDMFGHCHEARYIITLAWLGVDPDLDPVAKAETKTTQGTE